MEIVILAVFALGYLVLAGADIGVGMLLPYLGRSPAERREVIAAIAPFFLGNEVWLVASAGVLAGLFPSLEGELLSGHYGVVVALLVSWVTRDMALWLRDRLPGARWDTALVLGMIVALFPLLPASQAWVWWTFRHRVPGTSGGEEPRIVLA